MVETSREWGQRSVRIPQAGEGCYDVNAEEQQPALVDYCILNKRYGVGAIDRSEGSDEWVRKSLFAADFSRCETVEELDKLSGRWETEIRGAYGDQPDRLSDELLELREAKSERERQLW